MATSTEKLDDLSGSSSRRCMTSFCSAAVGIARWSVPHSCHCKPVSGTCCMVQGCVCFLVLCFYCIVCLVSGCLVSGCLVACLFGHWCGALPVALCSTDRTTLTAFFRCWCGGGMVLRPPRVWSSWTVLFSRNSWLCCLLLLSLVY